MISKEKKKAEENRRKRKLKGNIDGGLNVLGKSPRKGFFTADFLAADERVDSDGDGAVDVLR